jgi:hypothetical protein
VVEISKFKDAAFWACFWVAGEGGWPERVAKTLMGKDVPVNSDFVLGLGTLNLPR